MKILDMRELTSALILRGYDARYEMTGGNCGTIYLYHQEEENFGEVFLAIGPSSFDTGEANSDELNWGSIETGDDEDDEPMGSDSYFDEELQGREFNVENVASAIDDWEF